MLNRNHLDEFRQKAKSIFEVLPSFEGELDGDPIECTKKQAEILQNIVNEELEKELKWIKENS